MWPVYEVIKKSTVEELKALFGIGDKSMTPNLDSNKAYETLQGYGFPVVYRKEMQQEVPYPFFVIKMPESNRSKYTFDSYSGDTNLVIDIWSV